MCFQSGEDALIDCESFMILFNYGGGGGMFGSTSRINKTGTATLLFFKVVTLV